ncbi:MAG: ATP-binding cassette domain-containing protein, partial [Bacteroidota bacterium]
MLEVDSVELSFGNQKILYGLYLKAETGKVTGILGRNGSGKTSLLRIIFGSLEPKYKNIRIDGVYQKGKLFRKGEIAYLPQHQLLPNSLTLSQAFRLYGQEWEVFTAHFEAFSPYQKKRTHELSSGELRIVETYLTLFSGKEIILLDEPFSFIAPIYVEKFKNLIHKLNKNTAIIITDHF